MKTVLDSYPKLKSLVSSFSVERRRHLEPLEAPRGHARTIPKMITEVLESVGYPISTDHLLEMVLAKEGKDVPKTNMGGYRKAWLERATESGGFETDTYPVPALSVETHMGCAGRWVLTTWPLERRFYTSITVALAPLRHTTALIQGWIDQGSLPDSPILPLIRKNAKAFVDKNTLKAPIGDLIDAVLSYAEPIIKAGLVEEAHLSRRAAGIFNAKFDTHSNYRLWQLVGVDKNTASEMAGVDANQSGSGA